MPRKKLKRSLSKKQVDIAMFKYLLDMQAQKPPEESVVDDSKQIYPHVPKKIKSTFPNIPKGCIIWEFNAEGVIVTEENFDRSDARTYPVFNCIAINEKNARKKWDKWISKQLAEEEE